MVQQRGRLLRGVAALAIAVPIAAAVIPAQAVSTARPTTFVPGGASATSQAFAIDPRDAGLAATITVGRSIANYRNELTQASSQTLDLGLIGSTLTVQCNALPPALKPEQLPKPLVAESDKGTSQSTLNTAGQGSSSTTLAGGREWVLAKPPPHEIANSTFDGANITLPGVLSVKGLSSSAYAQLIPGQARIAIGTADIAQLDVAGQVQLSNLHWEAKVRTGTKPSRSASFTVGSVKIAGTPVTTPSASVGSALEAVNKALATTGLHLEVPTLTDANGVIAMTPLSVGIASSAVGAKLLDPIISKVFGDLLGGVVDSAAKAVCQIGSAYGLANLFIAAVDGIGALDLELGGATAQSDHKVYANPFGNGGGDTGTSTPVPGASTSTPPPSTGSSGGTATTPPLPGIDQTTAPAPSPQVAGTQTVASSCSTTSPSGRPSCSHGAGLAVGLIALAALGGVAAIDFLVVRRRKGLARMAIE